MLTALTLTGASCNDDTNQITEKETFIQSVLSPDTVRQGESFEIEFEITVSGCETYSRLLVEEIRNDLYFTIFIKDPSEGNLQINCVTGIFTEKIKEEIKTNGSGKKSLIFNDSTLVRKIFLTQ